jgi:hypothetical protein
LNQTHPHDGRDLLWVGFDAMLRGDEPEQHTSRNPKNAFLGVEFDVVRSEFSKGLLEVHHELVGPFGFDYDVFHISLNGLPDELPETLEHKTLICSPMFFRSNNIVT